MKKRVIKVSVSALAIAFTMWLFAACAASSMEEKGMMEEETHKSDMMDKKMDDNMDHPMDKKMDDKMGGSMEKKMDDDMGGSMEKKMDEPMEKKMDKMEGDMSHGMDQKMDKDMSGMKHDAMGTETATFAGGCFWCVEADFEKIPGVIQVVSGYSGGDEMNPTYEDVSYGRTHHLESVQVIYDPHKVSYGQLLEYFWRHVDPTDDGGQFVDRGAQYRTAIFYHSEAQHKAAEASKKALAMSGTFSRKIVTPIVPFKSFYKAEDYHQDFYKTHKSRYTMYRMGSGRDTFIHNTWGMDAEKMPMMKKDGMVKGGMKDDKMGMEKMEKDKM